jgi:hypothetical protein
MTPEELNRTIEFIIQTQSRLAAAQEQDRQDRLGFQKKAEADAAEQREINARLARLSETQTRLLEHQSERMDRMDKLHADLLRENREFHEEVRDFQKQALHLQKQALHLLNLILDRLPPPSSNPN